MTDADARRAAERDTSGDTPAAVPMKFFTLHQALRTTAEGGPRALERLWDKQSREAHEALASFYAEYHAIATTAVAGTP